MSTTSQGASALPQSFNHLSLYSRRSTKDWTLPPALISWLGKDTQQALDQLVPKPNNVVSNSPVQTAYHLPSFLTAMLHGGNTLTENGAVAHKTTSSALVDLFFDFAPGITPAHLFDLLGKAWKEDALTTLKVVFHARSIHEGKGFKEGFFRAMGWIWEYHPRTFLDNLHFLVDPTCKRPRDLKRDVQRRQQREEELLNDGDRVPAIDDIWSIEDNESPEYTARPHGSFDDLIDLLILHINGQLSSSYQGTLSAIDHALAPAFPAKHFKKARLDLAANPTSKRDRGGFKHILKAAAGRDVDPYTRQLWQAGTGSAKQALLHTRAENSLTTDGKFVALYLTVLDLLVRYLKEDLSLLAKHQDFLTLPDGTRLPYRGDSSPHLFGMSYAAKWVPTPAHGADKQILFSTALAMVLYPGDGVAASRMKLQKHVLTPLRKALAVPEVPMSNGSWKINYPKVPAKSMARNSEHFYKHDPKGFENYLRRVAKGEQSVSAASLQPHEVLIDAVGKGGRIKTQLADLQWAALVASLKTSSRNSLDNCLAIADVSGSMGSYMTPDSKVSPQPIMPCIALTLLLGELASPPWNGCFFTFSSTPKFEFIDPSLPLSERAASLSRASWEMTTNFYKVFDLILANAIREKLAPEQMIKKLFVFSDMQFNQARDGGFGDTEYQTIRAKFAKAGFPLPELVYWNLATRAAGTPMPVTSDTQGVTLVSGFSGALMKYFLRGEADNDAKNEEDEGYAQLGHSEEDLHDGKDKAKPKKEKKDPFEVLREVVSAECFDGLKVVD